MTQAPDAVLREYERIARQSPEFERLGDLFDTADGFACFKYDTREGFDVTYPAYRFDLSGRVSEITPLSSEWFELIDACPDTYGD